MITFNTSDKCTGSTSHTCSILGELTAIALSWFKWHSFWWAVLAGFFDWLYVLYYVLSYGTKVVIG